MLGDYPMVALFYWDTNGSQQLEQLFSVASSSQKRSVKAQAIVTHISAEESGGEWLCSKDGKASILPLLDLVTRFQDRQLFQISLFAAILGR